MRVHMIPVRLYVGNDRVTIRVRRLTKQQAEAALAKYREQGTQWRVNNEKRIK